MASHRRRAIDARQHADIVPGADLAVFSPEALEGRALLDRHELRRLCVLRMRVIVRNLAHCYVVFVHPLARQNVRLGKADDLPEFADRRTGWYLLDRQLVALRNSCERDEASRRHPLLDLIDSTCDIVRRVQPERARGRFHRLKFCHFRPFRNVVH